MLINHHYTRDYPARISSSAKSHYKLIPQNKFVHSKLEPLDSFIISKWISVAVRIWRSSLADTFTSRLDIWLVNTYKRESQSALRETWARLVSACVRRIMWSPLIRRSLYDSPSGYLLIFLVTNKCSVLLNVTRREVLSCFGTKFNYSGFVNQLNGHKRRFKIRSWVLSRGALCLVLCSSGSVVVSRVQVIDTLKSSFTRVSEKTAGHAEDKKMFRGRCWREPQIMVSW